MYRQWERWLRILHQIHPWRNVKLLDVDSSPPSFQSRWGWRKIVNTFKDIIDFCVRFCWHGMYLHLLFSIGIAVWASAVWASKILLDRRSVFFSWYLKDVFFHHMQWTSTVNYVLPFFGMYRHACRGMCCWCWDETSKKACVMDTTLLGASRQCPLILKGSLWTLYALYLAHSSCSSFHSAVLGPCGGAFGNLPHLLPVWITVKDGHLSMNLVGLFKLGCE